MFSTTNLRLRALHDLWNDARVQKTLSATYVVPLDDKFQETLKTWVTTGLMYCIIETKNTAEWVGFKNRDAMVSIALRPEFWGLGYGSEALRWLVDYSFRELGLHRLMLNVFCYNEAAVKLYKKAGFIEEGILRKASWSDGKWQDVFAMAILEEDWAASGLRRILVYIQDVRWPSS
ncbi:acyl-CoA N-acyltransferase [Rhodocollybia butyracea]|uniref:Acyl-CoA N-acyltransferase n=1 Tax=Rhodocollybia butyracea TaxID=206335 RepID=A0A9P5UFU1_9AGAR|nr:acyl-CoA N-acyltransferase [Rhodocollybia butyracea]